MVAAVGIIPLIYKAEGEDYLPGRAIKQQPEGNSFVMEERLNEIFGIVKQISKSTKRPAEQYYAQDEGHFSPYSFYIKIPYIYIIRYELSENYCEVFAQTTIDKKQNTSHKAANPIDYRRNNTLLPLRKNPLNQHSGGEKSLGNKSHRKYQSVYHEQKLLGNVVFPDIIAYVATFHPAKGKAILKRLYKTIA